MTEEKKTMVDTNGQHRIEGTYEPPPAVVVSLVEQYVSALRDRMRAQDREGTLRADCIEKMKEHGIEKVEIDSEKMLVLEHTESDKLKIKSAAKTE